MGETLHMKKKQRDYYYYRKTVANIVGGIAGLGAMGFCGMGLPGMAVGLGVAVGIVAVTLAVAGLIKGIQAFRRARSGSLPSPKEVKDMFNKELEAQIETGKKAIGDVIKESDKVDAKDKDGLISDATTRMEQEARSRGAKAEAEAVQKYADKSTLGNESGKDRGETFHEAVEDIKKQTKDANPSSEGIAEKVTDAVRETFQDADPDAVDETVGVVNTAFSDSETQNALKDALKPDDASTRVSQQYDSGNDEKMGLK